MKYNSIHRFAELESARDFANFIKNAGFCRAGADKDGGVIYTNGKGHSLLIFVKP